MNSIYLDYLPKIGIIFFSILGIFIFLKIVRVIFFDNKELDIKEKNEQTEENFFPKSNNQEIIFTKNKFYINSESDSFFKKKITKKEFESENDEEYKYRELNEN